MSPWAGGHTVGQCDKIWREDATGGQGYPSMKDAEGTACWNYALPGMVVTETSCRAEAIRLKS
jgi:hypothetical protein